MGNSKVWVVHSDRNGTRLEHFLTAGVVDIGWGAVGVVGPEDTREQIRRRYEAEFPGRDTRKVGSQVGSILRFNQEMAVGDIVVTNEPPGKGRRETKYHVGIVIGEPDIVPGTDGPDGYRYYQRRVEWRNHDAWDTMVWGALPKNRVSVCHLEGRVVVQRMEMAAGLLTA